MHHAVENPHATQEQQSTVAAHRPIRRNAEPYPPAHRAARAVGLRGRTTLTCQNSVSRPSARPARKSALHAPRGTDRFRVRGDSLLMYACQSSWRTYALRFMFEVLPSRDASAVGATRAAGHRSIDTEDRKSPFIRAATVVFALDRLEMKLQRFCGPAQHGPRESDPNMKP